MAPAVTLTSRRSAVVVVVLAFVLIGCLVLYVEGEHWGLTFLLVVAILVCVQWPTDGRRSGAGPTLPVQVQGAASASSSVAPALPREPPVYVYRKRKAGDVCAVCLGEVRRGEVVKRLPACAHLFHEGCIDKWLSSRKTCPVCRSRVDVAAAAADLPAAEAAAPSRAGS